MNLFPSQNHREITELLSFSQWQNPLGEIVAYLCRTKKIDVADVASKRVKLPVASFAYKQLVAFEATNNRSYGWKTKYAIATELKGTMTSRTLVKNVKSKEADGITFYALQGDPVETRLCKYSDARQTVIEVIDDLKRFYTESDLVILVEDAEQLHLVASSVPEVSTQIFEQAKGHEWFAGVVITKRARYEAVSHVDNKADASGLP